MIPKKFLIRVTTVLLSILCLQLNLHYEAEKGTISPCLSLKQRYRQMQFLFILLLVNIKFKHKKLSCTLSNTAVDYVSITKRLRSSQQKLLHLSIHAACYY